MADITVEEAIISNNFAELREILSRNDEAVHTLFVSAAELGQLEVCKWLAKFNPNSETEAFNYAAENGHLHILKWLVKWFKPDVNNNDDLAFMWAASHGHLDVLKWLMQFNPDVHTTYEFPFRHAALGGHIEVCKWLMQFNPDVRAKQDEVFIEAAISGNLELFKWLLWQINSEDYYMNEYVLDFAARNKQFEMLKYLFLLSKFNKSIFKIESVKKYKNYLLDYKSSILINKTTKSARK